MPQYDPPPSVFPDYTGGDSFPVEPDPIAGGNSTYLNPFNPAGMPENYDPFGGAYNDNLSGGGSYVDPGGQSISPTDWRNNAMSNPRENYPRPGGGRSSFPRRGPMSYMGAPGAVGDLIRRWAQRAIEREGLRRNAMSRDQRLATLESPRERFRGDTNFYRAGGNISSPSMRANTSDVHWNYGTHRYELDRDPDRVQHLAGGEVGGSPTNFSGARRPQSDTGTNRWVEGASAVRDELGGFAVTPRMRIPGATTTPEGREWGRLLTTMEGRERALAMQPWMHPERAPIPGSTSAPPIIPTIGGGYG